MAILRGTSVRLRPAAMADASALVAIRETPEVFARWGGTDVRAEVVESIEGDEAELFVVETDADGVIGAIQFHEEDDPDYRHAGIDIYLAPSVHGGGLGTDAVRTLVRHLVDDHGHHRLTIDPAADNAAAIRCYAKVGFREVGVMRAYERGPDGTFHDGLLMEMLADEFIR